MRNSLIALLALLAMIPPGKAGAEIELISKIPPRIAPGTALGLLGFLQRPALSDDGRFVVFLSSAPNLVPGQIDPEPGFDIFLHDRVSGSTHLITHAAGSPATAADRGLDQSPSVSADSRFVAFASFASNLTPGVEESADTQNIYLWDRETGQTTLASRRAGTQEDADAGSLSPVLSADGSVLVFVSHATDLVPGTTLAHRGENVYLYERASGAVVLVSRSAASASRSGNNTSFGPAVSADGRYVAYLSGATDLVAGQNDINGEGQDIFLFDRFTGATTLVSHVSGSALTTPNGSSHGQSLSADGRYVVFGSHGTDLVPGVSDTNGEPDAFLFDRLQGTVSFVSLSGGSPEIADGGYEPQISRDGSTVAYFLDNPGQPQGGQIVAYDVPTGSRSLVTRTPESPFTFADRGATYLSLSANGRLVTFTSRANNLVTGQQDLNRGDPDVFVHDRTTGATNLVSHAAGSPVRSGALGSSYPPVISADGSWIAYGSFAFDLVAGVRDPGGSPDLFLYERAAGDNRIVTLHAPGLASLTGLGDSRRPAMSADGRYVAFTSNAALLPGLETQARFNVYLHDRVTRRTVLVSRSTGPGFAGGNGNSEEPRISRDGGVVIFHSQAGDLVPGQDNRGGTFGVFLWDRRTGRTTLVSHAHASRTRVATGRSFVGDVSADGNVVAFTSTATDLVRRQRDTNNVSDVFVWDRRTGATALVSHHPSRASRTGNGASLFSSMSADGAFIAFDSAAFDLAVPVLDLNSLNDAFVYERRTGRVSLLSRAGGAFSGRSPLISANGRWAAFIAGNRDQTRESIVLLNRATGGAIGIAPSTPRVNRLHGFSDNGRWLLLSSDAPDLVPGQTEDVLDVDLFLFDRVSREVRLVSHVPGDPLRAAGRAFEGHLSPDGRWTAFTSSSSLLLPEAAFPPILNVFRYDRTTEEVTLVTRSAFDPSRGAHSESFEPVVINSGLVAFTSQAGNLVPRDFNSGLMDVFVYVPEGLP